MGLGRFGGGVGVTRFLVARGAQVLVTDLEPAERLRRSVEQLAGLDVRFVLGEHRESDFAAADLVVVNPAVPPDNRFVAAALQAGAAITSEIRLLVRHLPNRLRTIGVTGSAGKSTTTAMIGHILGKTLGDDRVHVGGNLGGSLLGELERIGPDDWVVLELSSFMLEGLREDRWSPHIAVVTNFTPNHLDWHGSVEAYKAAKQGILDFQQPGMDHAVFGPGIHNLFSHPSHMAYREWQDVTQSDPPALLVPGRHNQMNALLAADTVATATDMDWLQAVQVLEDFPGLPHRLQFVAEHAGVRYYNDSKSTTPEAAALAIESFAPDTVHVILGGYDKGSDLQPLAGLARQRCRALYAIGATGPTIAAAARETPGNAVVLDCETLDNAMRQITARLRRGDVVLLSPACASWGQYENYEQRGAAFVEAVLRYTGEGV